MVAADFVGPASEPAASASTQQKLRSSFNSESDTDPQSFSRHKTRIQRASTISHHEQDPEQRKARDGTLAAAQSVGSLMNLSRGGTLDDDEKLALQAKIQQQTERFRKQIKSYRKHSLDPHSRIVQRWDILTALALLFTATITPFEVGIIEPGTLDEMLVDPLFYINRLVDAIFMTDIVVQCFMSYQEPAHRGGAWVHSLPRIFCHYLRTWMPLDLVIARGSHRAGLATRSPPSPH